MGEKRRGGGADLKPVFDEFGVSLRGTVCKLSTRLQPVLYDI